MKQLNEIIDLDLFTPVNRHFARFIQKLERDEYREETATLALWLSYLIEAGHVCLNLNEPISKHVPHEYANTVKDWDPAPLIKILKEDSLVDFREPAQTEATNCPFVLTSAGKLYLQRYWKYENELISNLTALVANDPDSAIDETLKETFTQLNDLQKTACTRANRHNLCIITGGPGTGKTFTLLPLLRSIARVTPEVRIQLAAFTGKAAARMRESIEDNLQKADDVRPQSRERILAQDSKTIHRLLGVIPNSSEFRHNKDNKLKLDVLVVDECSMIDLPLLSKLMDAIPEHAKLIMLGDKDQLPSVGSGCIFSDICTLAEEGKILKDAYTRLEKNHRSQESIKAACEHISAGDPDRLIEVMQNDSNETQLLPLPSEDQLNGSLLDTINEKYMPLRKAVDPEEALTIYSQFRILTALRKGPYGSENINHIVKEQIIGNTTRTIYTGMPIIVTGNDYNLNLFNGDTGVVFPEKPGSNRLCVWFRNNDGGLRKVAHGLLTSWEPAYALTVHKSQGSEFDEVQIYLSDTPNPVITRELVYTALSRAKNKATLISNPSPLKEAIHSTVSRTSGLADRL